LAVGLTWFVGANSLTWEVRKITWFLLAIALVQARTAVTSRATSTGTSGDPRIRRQVHADPVVQRT
jgi:hypothetical protein